MLDIILQRFPQEVLCPVGTLALCSCQLFARTMCLILLTVATGNVFLLEQPFGTLLRWYPRLRHLTCQFRVPCLQHFTTYSFCKMVYSPYVVQEVSPVALPKTAK